MDSAAIALNRFGLGVRPSDSLPADGRAWLLRQLELYQPRPKALAPVPSRRQVAGQLADYFDQVRTEARARRQQPMKRASQPSGGSDALAGLAEPTSQYLRRAIRDQYMAMNSARISAAVAAEATFLERLVHFWANHFAVSGNKLPVIGMAGLLEFEAIRPNLLGRFADMLLAAERHPAMLFYLDQAQSIGPNSSAAALPRARRQQRGLNENLAREILELHTLGVDGGYSQADVTEFARALTGWTVGGIARGPAERLLGSSAAPGDFLFAELIHEPGERTIMGRRYAQAGEAQARTILSDLAVHPSTARHLATKLARHFAGDEPPPAMVRRLERAFLTSGGDLPIVYRAIVESPEAWAPRPLKFKTPWDWVVSALRGLNVESLPPEIAVGALAQLGQPTWRPASPAGWDDVAASWAGPDALVRRAEVAERIGDRAGTSVDARALAEKLLPGSLGEATRQAVMRAASPQQALALLLVSPEFLRR